MKMWVRLGGAFVCAALGQLAAEQHVLARAGLLAIPLFLLGALLLCSCAQPAAW